jgi:hypothetical protein
MKDYRHKPKKVCDTSFPISVCPFLFRDIAADPDPRTKPCLFVLSALMCRGRASFNGTPQGGSRRLADIRER